MCMYVYIYIYIYLYHISPTCFCAYCTIPMVNADCNVVTLVTKHTIYHMWVLQRYLLLLEPYLALCFVLKVT
jgi:hypothetical protein